VTFVGSVQIIMNKLSGDSHRCVQLEFFLQTFFFDKKHQVMTFQQVLGKNAKIYRTKFVRSLFSVAHKIKFTLLALSVFFYSDLKVTNCRLNLLLS